MIFTFEGAPAVGKTTISEKLNSDHDCYVVPEVNKLFGKENRKSDLWYYQKQIERCQLSILNQSSPTLSILDGDVFQPIWFSSLFPDEDWGDFEKMVDFYRDMIEKTEISFPNKYIYFHTKERVRALRETGRSKLRGKNAEEIIEKIDRYRDFSISQREYFSALKDEFPKLVIFMESSDKKVSIQKILSYSTVHKYNDREIFEFIIEWCKKKQWG